MFVNEAVGAESTKAAAKMARVKVRYDADTCISGRGIRKVRFASVGETVAFQAPNKRVGQIQDMELSISVFCLSFTHFPPHTPAAFDEDSKAAAVTNEMGYRKSSDTPLVSDQNNISRLSRPQAYPRTP
jgi:hypothetical protein